MAENPSEIAVLSSGGVESCTLLADLSGQYATVHPLYIQSGLLWEKVELYWLRRYLKALRSSYPVGGQHKDLQGGPNPFRPARIREITVLKLPLQDLYSGHWSLTGHNVPDYESPDVSVYLPGRNAILLCKAALYCAMNRIDALALGLLKGNPFPDSSRAFLDSFEQSFSLALERPVSFLTPYLATSKGEIIRRGSRLPLKLSFSCIQPVGRQHCGNCNKCAERQRAFAKAGVKDETVYRNYRGSATKKESPGGTIKQPVGIGSGCT